ncbi:hypothetical protein GWI33_000171 [Rhynchophorus ferrugineus]|uniref:DUF4817 domain-containing protein n=1 Tax=Rhynchophorus ferrugineus TaxID=354439 RepID=A0A834J3M1_RHYFE|nr:hypothetical protein GWI33_000171 [Rhynchophorus ferrugineus]
MKKEFHVLIKYCFLKGKNTVEAKTWLDAEFPYTAPGKSTIKDWYDAQKRLLPTKTEKDHQQRLLHSVIGPFEGRNRRKTAAFKEIENAASLRQYTVSQIWAPSDYFLFSDLQRMLAGKKCSSNEEVIAETEAYFEAKDK